ncbi:MAG: PorT family protein [Gemmatimonadaceae bacterium]|nr:PorT family protein [Gemmatimonadaceae bacterium]
MRILTSCTRHHGTGRDRTVRARASRRVFLAALVAAASLLPGASAMGQGQVGVLLGATYSTLRGVDGLDGRTGLVGGLSILFPSEGFLAFQTEALLVNKGAKASTGDPEGLRLSYVEVPLMARLTLNRGGTMHPHLYAGPYLGFEVDCSVKGTAAACDDIPGVNTHSVDVGGLLGGGVDYDVGPLVLTGGVRYSFGVSNVADFSFDAVDESARNGVYALYAGAAFRFGRR